MSTPSRAWAVTRAALITVVIGVEWLDALPLPTLQKSHLRHPVAQAELERWTSVLNGAGIPISKEALTEHGLTVGAASVAFRRASMAPFRPIKSRTMTGQSWGLFAYPDPFAGQLIVEVDDGSCDDVGELLPGEGSAGCDGEWRPLWAAPGQDRSLLSRQLRYRRVRGVYDDAGDLVTPRRIYSRFADWVARAVFAAEPAVDKVRLRIDLIEIRLPGEAEPPPQRRHQKIRSREQLVRKDARLRQAHAEQEQTP